MEGAKRPFYSDPIENSAIRAVCSFVRNISNNHSSEDAARLLFSHQPNVPGSGYLQDYIGDLPRSDMPEGVEPS